MRYADNYCTYTEQYQPTHTYTFTGPCVVTGKPYSVTVPADGLYRYRQGAYIQDAFPNLSKEDREFLISGMSPEGWKSAFGEPCPLCGDTIEPDDETQEGEYGTVHKNCPDFGNTEA